MSADPSKLKLVKEVSRRDILLALALREDSARVLVGSSDFRAYDGDLAAEKFEPGELAAHESYVTGAGWLDGETAVTCGYDGRLVWWNVAERQATRTVTAHERWIRGLAVSPDRRLIATVADDMKCRLWRADTGEAAGELAGHADRTPHHFPSMLYACAFTPDGQHLATADRVGKIVVWKLADGSRAAELAAPLMYTWDPRQRIHSIGGIRSLAFSGDGALLAAGGIGQIGNIDHLGGPSRIEIFAWRQGERTHEFSEESHKGLVEKLHFDPAGRWLLAVGGDNGGFVQFFDLESKKAFKQEKAPMHVHALAVSDDQSTLYGAGHGRLAVWELKG